MEDFYHRLSYSFGNEDCSAEKRALNIQKGDKIVCVTASGDRPLNLLTEDCGSITSIDANPMQNALLDLKMTAMRELDYEDYLAFLGLNPSKKRLMTYKELCGSLDAKSHALWLRHKRALRKGVLFQGAMEKRMRAGTFLIQLTKKAKVKKLFSFEDVELQKEYARKNIDTKGWKRVLNFALQPQLTRLFFKDPGLYEYVDRKMHIGQYLHDRIQGAFERFPAKQSWLLSMLFCGKVNKDHLPSYLTPVGLKQIKPRLDRIQYKTQDLISFLEQAPDNSYDCFSLSDVASYIPLSAFEQMVQAVYRTAKPGARFVIRQFLTNYSIPEKMAPYFERNLELEKRLADEDCCAVYRFITGTIKKD